MLRKNRIPFFFIIGLALVVTLGALALERLGIYTLPSRAVERTTIQVAIPSNLAAWARDEAENFNARNADANVQTVSINGLTAFERYSGSPVDSLPHGWMPDASFIAAIAVDEGLAFEVAEESIVSTELIWGAYADRAQALNSLDWNAVHEAAVTGTWAGLGGDAQWGNFKLTIASPTGSAEGLGALIAAAAEYHDTESLTREQLADPGFTQWMREIVESVPNFNTLGPNPAESLATRGPSVGDVGFLSEAAWIHSQSGLERWGDFVTQDSRYPVSLDYPFLVRTNADPAEQELARRFARYLKGQVEDLGEGYQNGAEAPLGNQMDGRATLVLLRWAERERLGQ